VQPGSELPPEEQDWHRFQQLRHLHNHWQRPGWSEGRRSYHWFLTFEHAADLRALAAQCQEPFRGLAQFDVVPLDSLHLTVHRLAFTDELPACRLAAMAVAVRKRCQGLIPLQLRIGWLAASTGAIRFTVLPVGAIEEIRGAVVAKTNRYGADESAPTYIVNDNFWPHVSIAYSNTVQQTAAIASKIKAMRSLPPTDVLVSSVTLVELRQENRRYRWDELERVSFGG
jgi:2'-5' RNA ligase